MMPYDTGTYVGRIITAFFIAWGLTGFMHEVGPVYLAQDGINWVAVIFWIVLLSCWIAIIRDAAILIAEVLQCLSMRIPRGNKGKARFGTWRDIKKDALKLGWGPYWGALHASFLSKPKPIFADYASNAVTYGPAGSGKGVGVVIPTCLSIRESKLLPDFKGSNTVMLKPALEKRGEQLRVLNIGNQHSQILGESDQYNPLHIIADCFTRSGGLADVVGIVDELAAQLYPDPPHGRGEDQFWINGTRDMLSFAIFQSILIKGHNATLGDIDLLLNDREALLQDAQWAAGTLEEYSHEQ